MLLIELSYSFTEKLLQKFAMYSGIVIRFDLRGDATEIVMINFNVRVIKLTVIKLMMTYYIV